MQSIRDEINEIKGFDLSEVASKELVIIERRKKSEKPMTIVKANVGFSPPTSLVKSNNSIVNLANVLVPKNKTTNLLSNAAEKNQKIESSDTEIILQNSKIRIEKRWNYQIETEVNNDVYTVLDHPAKKREKADASNKKETLYESRVRPGRVPLLVVTSIEVNTSWLMISYL